MQVDQPPMRNTARKNRRHCGAQTLAALQVDAGTWRHAGETLVIPPTNAADTDVCIYLYTQRRYQNTSLTQVIRSIRMT